METDQETFFGRLRSNRFLNLIDYQLWNSNFFFFSIKLKISVLQEKTTYKGTHSLLQI